MPWKCPILRHTTSHHPPAVSTEWMNVDASRQPPRCQGWNSSEMSWLKGSEDAEQYDFDGQSLMNFLDIFLKVYIFHVITLIWKLKLWFHLFSLFFKRSGKKTGTKAYSFNRTGWLVPKISKNDINKTSPPPFSKQGVINPPPWYHPLDPGSSYRNSIPQTAGISTRWNCCNSWRHHLGNWTPKGEETMSIERCLLYDMIYTYVICIVYIFIWFLKIFLCSFLFLLFCVRVCVLLFSKFHRAKLMLDLLWYLLMT